MEGEEGRDREEEVDGEVKEVPIPPHLQSTILLPSRLATATLTEGREGEEEEGGD